MLRSVGFFESLLQLLHFGLGFLGGCLVFVDLCLKLLDTSFSFVELHSFVVVAVDFELIDCGLVFAFEALAGSCFGILDQFVDVFRALSVLCGLNNRTPA